MFDGKKPLNSFPRWKISSWKGKLKVLDEAIDDADDADGGDDDATSNSVELALFLAEVDDL